VAVVSLLGLVAVALSRRDAPPPAPPPGAPDVVRGLGAGLRADATGTAGEAAFLEAFGREPGLRCTAAYAQSTRPYTSLGSLLTGRYPSAVPLCGHRGFGLFSEPGARLWCSQIPPDRHTLTGILEAHGYRTHTLYAGRQAEATAAPEGGQGVDRLSAHAGLSSPQDLAEDAAAWWRSGDDRPRLLIVVDTTVFDLRHEHLPGKEPPRDHLYADHRGRGAALGERIRSLTGEIDGSGGRPLWVVATSLCGLNLAEGSGSDDGYLDTLMQTTVADRTAHVPLLIFGPDSAAVTRVLEQPVELVDVLPTVLSRAGIEPPVGLPGEDLWLLEGPGDPSSTAYIEFGDSLAVRRGDHLLTFRYHLHNATALDPTLTLALTDLAPLRRDRGTPRYYRLHDVVADPLQTTNLLDERMDVAEDLHRALVEVRTGPAAPPGGTLGEDQVEALRAFREGGYW